MFKKFFDDIISQNYSFGDYEYEKYNCELAKLASQMKNADVRGIMDFWERKAKEDYFELAHPIYNHIILRAVKSFGGCNNVLNIVFSFLSVSVKDLKSAGFHIVSLPQFLHQK